MLPDDFSPANIVILAEATAGFSGSDLKEMCRDASMMPLREYMREKDGDPAEMAKSMKEVSSSLALFIDRFCSIFGLFRDHFFDPWSYVTSLLTTIVIPRSR